MQPRRGSKGTVLEWSAAGAGAAETNGAELQEWQRRAAQKLSQLVKQWLRGAVYCEYTHKENKGARVGRSVGTFVYCKCLQGKAKCFRRRGKLVPRRASFASRFTATSQLAMLG